MIGGYFFKKGVLPLDSTVEIENIQWLSDNVKDLLTPTSPEDAKLVQKGLMLYRQGMVSLPRFTGGVFTATVQDVIPAKVELDPDSMRLCECSCPSDDICRHMLAVFFSVYAKIGSVSDWVTEWREPVREQKSAFAWGLQKAKDLVKANGVLKPDYERWVKSFETSFDALLGAKNYTSPYVVSELFGIYQQRIRASAPVEQEWRMLYDLIAAVVSFRKLAALSDRLGHEEHVVQRAYLHLFQRMTQDAEDLVGKMNMRTLPFAFDAFMERLKDDVFELLGCTARLEQERFFLYRLLWTELFKQRPWREAEVEKVRLRGKELKDWENPVPFLLARIHLNLLLEHDELAMKMMAEIDEDVITPHLVYWIGYFSGPGLKAWRRVGPLVELFVHKLKGYLEGLGGYHSCAVFVRNAMRTIAPYCTESGREDLYERALTAALPYSFADYEYVLFERGQFERWGELQAFVGLDFYDLPKERVKLVEKEKPEVLLSMLHQTAQREIDAKNRSSYRLAVRHLKKLRTLYKKLKRVDDWEYFLGELMERTKRLRAFHEECQRGKLI